MQRGRGFSGIQLTIEDLPEKDEVTVDQCDHQCDLQPLTCRALWEAKGIAPEEGRFRSEVDEPIGGRWAIDG